MPNLDFWPRLFKRRIALPTDISLSSGNQITNQPIQLRYPVDSAIHLLNNWDLIRRGEDPSTRKILEGGSSQRQCVFCIQFTCKKLYFSLVLGASQLRDRRISLSTWKILAPGKLPSLGRFSSARNKQNKNGGWSFNGYLCSLLPSLLLNTWTEISACKPTRKVVSPSKIFLVLGSSSLHVNSPLDTSIRKHCWHYLQLRFPLAVY